MERFFFLIIVFPSSFSSLLLGSVRERGSLAEIVEINASLLLIERK